MKFLDADRDLIQRFKDGDLSSFDELVSRYHRRVINLIYRFTGNSQSAEDLAQEVFLKVYRGICGFQGRCKFFTWLYQITLNLCLRERKRLLQKQVDSLDDAMDNGNTPSSGDFTQEAFQKNELSRLVRKAVLSLPSEQRMAVILCKYHDLSYEEAAEILGISLTALKSRLHRAKLALKDTLAPYISEVKDYELQASAGTSSRL